jgi:hypothetical protein
VVAATASASWAKASIVYLHPEQSEGTSFYPEHSEGSLRS